MGFWWDEIELDVISYSNHHFLAAVLDNDARVVWCAVGIYAWLESSNKHLTWQSMKELRDTATLPMVFFDDFNEMLLPNEKDGGPPIRECHMLAFKEVVDYYGLRDLGNIGD